MHDYDATWGRALTPARWTGELTRALFTALLVCACRSGAPAAPVEPAEPVEALEIVAAGSSSGNAPTLILLHGLGGDAADILALARRAELPPETRIIAPQGPQPGPSRGRAWWQVDAGAFGRARASGDIEAISRAVPEGLAGTRERVAALVRQLAASGSGPIVLAGFSQGGILALDVALATDTPLAGVVVLSGMVIAEDDWRVWAPKRRGLPVVVSHGRDDKVVPLARAERLRALLEGAGLSVLWRPFDGGHQPAVEALREAAAWLR